jgi:hypothetical protein
MPADVVWNTANDPDPNVTRIASLLTDPWPR